MPGKSSILLAIVVAAVAVAAGVWLVTRGVGHPSRPPNRPNILLVTFDTTRLDRLGCYGHDRPTSPRIDALAAEGVRYTQCRSTSSWTLPAHASLFTGRFVSAHGAHYDPNGSLTLSEVIPSQWAESFQVYGLHDSIPTLAGLLADSGYATGGVIGGPWLDEAFGLARGFEYYDDQEINSTNGRPAWGINRLALPWIDRVAHRPFFLFLNYFDPHDPYDPPQEYRDRFPPRETDSKEPNASFAADLALYDAEIAYADHHFGEVIDKLKALGLYDDTWIIVTADHGELFGEHGLRLHGKTLYEEELHVPLIMKLPKPWARTGVDHEPIQLTDLLPMILERLGLPPLAEVQGAAEARRRLPSFAEVYPTASESDLGHFRAYYRGQVKYIWNSRGRHRLHDLEKDPKEHKNLYGERLDQAMAMRETMQKMIKALPRPKTAAAPRRIDPKTIEALRGLGYITTGGPASKPTSGPGATTHEASRSSKNP